MLINYDRITLQDCLDNYYLRGQAVLLKAGRIVRFIDAKAAISTETAANSKKNYSNTITKVEE